MSLSIHRELNEEQFNFTRRGEKTAEAGWGGEREGDSKGKSREFFLVTNGACHI